MNVNKTIVCQEFKGEDGDCLFVSYDKNLLGAGVAFHLARNGYGRAARCVVTLDAQELGSVRDALESPVNKVSLNLTSANGDVLSVKFENRGEPYREGVGFTFHDEDYESEFHVFLEWFDIGDLRDFLAAIPIALQQE